MDYQNRHHTKLHADIPAWRRREIARNTGVKCERSEYTRSYKDERVRQRDVRLRAEERQAIRDYLAG